MDATPAIHLTRDGKNWCAVLPDFKTLAESPAGFGATADEAIKGLEAEVIGQHVSARTAAQFAERELEHQNYHQRPFDQRKKEEAVVQYDRCDKLADECRDRYRLFVSILNPANTVEKQIMRDVEAYQSAR